MAASSFKTWWALPQSRITLLILFSVILIAILSKWTGSNNPKYSQRFTRQMNRIVQQANKWHTTSKQDGEPILQLIHSNYALAYANVARALASDETIQQMSGVKLGGLIHYLEEDQQKALQKVMAQCPDVRPVGLYSGAASAWMP